MLPTVIRTQISNVVQFVESHRRTTIIISTGIINEWAKAPSQHHHQQHGTTNGTHHNTGIIASTSISNSNITIITTSNINIIKCIKITINVSTTGSHRVTT